MTGYCNTLPQFDLPKLPLEAYSVAYIGVSSLIPCNSPFPFLHLKLRFFFPDGRHSPSRRSCNSIRRRLSLLSLVCYSTLSRFKISISSLSSRLHLVSYL
ncbi:unnamed protein product [Cuscuta campestris]|uniref:Uncharacterized protein n=1 Tax=Cuscuta campestris TaxID=132261 RepID=A0A484MWA3_9ASTE|nr:unnamed protein product [Cuscuta campestris]VFQ92789.1 unnamed protein product [Cuscuta campestris]